MTIETLDDWLSDAPALRGRRVFVRADLNVPLDQGAVADDTRIRGSLPTLQRLADAGARVVVASHLGRPKGQVRPELSLRPVAVRMGELLGRPVGFVPLCIGAEAEAAADALTEGGLLLLENLRFHPGERKNDPDFVAALGRLAPWYVNDAFGTSHRAHASTVGIAVRAERVAAGDLLQRELAELRRVLDPERPFLCLLGGAKVSDKLAALEALVQRADVVAVGGAMAYTLLAAQGLPVGTSRVEEDRKPDARRVLDAASASGHRLLLPSDHVVAQSVDANAEVRVVKEIPAGWMGLDIGPETASAYAAEARRARTVFWNGPMGVFEVAPFAEGTMAVARAVAESDAASVVGGGDSIAAINRAGVADAITHLSTGGGASLEFAQGRALPGVTALER